MKRWPLGPMNHLAVENKLLVGSSEDDTVLLYRKRPTNRLHK